MGVIPVELFELITSFLSRAEVKQLRLVCKEFETKVSSEYFKNVVVPFRSELYSELNRNAYGKLIQSPANLFTNGMRIFKDFGPHILRFALSLELDEDDLAYPPIKPVQQAVPAFWGIYRWPHENYHRYTELEDLEETADELNGMKEALNCLTKVTNLGLCCDPGLGFLLGPDQTARRSAAARKPVFSVQDWRRDEPRIMPDNPPLTFSHLNKPPKAATRAPLSGSSRFMHRLLENMASEAGYTPEQQEEAIRLMLDTEHTTLQGMDLDERIAAVNADERLSGVSHRRRDSNSWESFSIPDVFDWPLAPTNLSRPQKELLLELEWAHRALIQSFVICLIDNLVTDHFNNVTTLTIAKIPSGHLNMLARHDLWLSLPNLKNVSLGVIADWRRVHKTDVGFIQDTQVNPVKAVGKTFELLNRFIGSQKNIESLRFEWICGGEFAPSRYQRNQYVLPAPFMSDPELMASPRGAMDTTDPLLALPHIKHLSLTNCWVSPHVFTQVIRKLALWSLEKLELESVSLSGPPTLMPQPPLWQQQQLIPHHANTNHVNFAADWTFQLDTNLGDGVNVNPLPDAVDLNGNGGHDGGHPMAGHVDDMDSMWLLPDPQQTPQVDWDVPDADPNPEEEPQAIIVGRQWATWSAILDHFSPGPKLCDILSQPEKDARRVALPDILESMATYVPAVSQLRRDQRRYKLKHLSLKSCGYAALDVHHLHTRAIALPDRPALFEIGGSGEGGISSAMQQTKEKLLARVCLYARPKEIDQLERAFGMVFGWHGIYDEKTTEDAIADGFECPGMGRFSGKILGRSAADTWVDDDSDGSAAAGACASGSSSDEL